MARIKRQAYRPVTVDGVQGAGQPVDVESVVKQGEEFARENAPAVTNTFKPVAFIVIGSYQCRLPGYTSVSGNQESGYKFIANTKELADWCEKNGFKKAE